MNNALAIGGRFALVRGNLVSGGAGGARICDCLWPFTVRLGLRTRRTTGDSGACGRRWAQVWGWTGVAGGCYARAHRISGKNGNSTGASWAVIETMLTGRRAAHHADLPRPLDHGDSKVTVEKKIVTVRTSKGLKDYTYLGCPLTNSRTAWCFRLCTPDEKGCGRCGRLAPHGMKSKIQLGIERHTAQKRIQSHCENLERMYLAAACRAHGDAGIHVSEGEAEIVLPVGERDHATGGAVHRAVYFGAMEDAAALAANSMINSVLLRNSSFDVSFSEANATGELIARGRFVGLSKDEYLAEAALFDPEGNEIARGSGVYVGSGTPLTPDIGYE